ncbi:hypothetical protein F4811DRAFT_503256 [Daldinia bambusicola]|nr:hypothetical protein F4811DRAFT_503256 [Daldinia bambusicola]
MEELTLILPCYVIGGINIPSVLGVLIYTLFGIYYIYYIYYVAYIVLYVAGP